MEIKKILNMCTINHFISFKDEQGDTIDEVSYEDLVKLVFDDVEWFYEEYEGDYSGDFYMLGKKGEQYYFLTMAYGSCSGCDILKGIETEAELEELLEKIKDVVFVKNKEEMIMLVKKFDYG